MKEIKLVVPEEKAQEFAKDVAALLDKHDVKLENQEAPICLLPITERVKTFEDACKVANYDIDTFNENAEGWEPDIVAYMKLRIIAAALNEGWKPQFADDEYRWLPFFRYYTAEEIAEMTDERKEELGLVGARAHRGTRSGLGCVNSLHAWSNTHAGYASRLVCKSKELADYFGHQFKDIWKVYVGKWHELPPHRN